MSKEKSELQLAAERIESLVNLTNVKINELGNHAYSLNNVLTIIQNQFDKIRNVPSDTKRKYELAKEVRLEWKQQVDKIEHDYNSATKVELSTGAATTGMGVGVATLGPTAAMSIATTFGVASTGTPIATLSGAAATKAALAWLGGGAIAAGGAGIAGGSALLALAGPIGWGLAGVAAIFLHLNLHWQELNGKLEILKPKHQKLLRLLSSTKALNKKVELDMFLTAPNDYCSEDYPKEELVEIVNNCKTIGKMVNETIAMQMQ